MPELVPVWAASGTLAVPDATKIAQGWFLGEKPPHEWMNWWQNLITQRLNHVLANGVAGWDASITYQPGAFARQSGLLWRSLTTNINKPPASNPTDWLQITQNASSLTSGVLPNARLQGNYNQVTNFTISGKLIANELAGDGNGLTNLNASQLGTGNVPNARLSNSYTNIINLTASGTITGGNFVGNGAGLTGLNANNLTAGTLPNARMSGNYSFNALTLDGLLTADRATLTNWLAVGSNITATGNVTANNFSGSGSGLTGLNASQLSTGTLPNARMSGGYSFDSLSLAATLSVSGAATFGSINDTPIGLATPRQGQFLGLGVVNSVTVGGNVTATGNITGASFSGNLNATDLVSGTLDAARLPNTAAGRNWVLNRIATLSLGAVGTFAFLGRNSGTSINPGTIYDGSTLHYSSVFQGGGAADVQGIVDTSVRPPAGSQWMALGRSTGTENNPNYAATLFVRVS